MAQVKINDRKDILLLLLYSPGCSDKINEPFGGRTRLVKTLFLFRHEGLQHFRRGTDLSDDAFYQFFPWSFGPFSREVYDDLTFFILRGFIESDPAEEESLPESAAEWQEWLLSSGGHTSDSDIEAFREEIFHLTSEGVTFTARLYDLLSSSQRHFLKQFKARLTTAPLRAILRYVYETYPNQTDRSQIREIVLGRDPSIP